MGAYAFGDGDRSRDFDKVDFLRVILDNREAIGHYIVTIRD